MLYSIRQPNIGHSALVEDLDNGNPSTLIDKEIVFSNLTNIVEFCSIKSIKL